MADAPAWEEGAFCPVYAVNLLQEKWTLHIVRALLEGPDLTDMRLHGTVQRALPSHRRGEPGHALPAPGPPGAALARGEDRGVLHALRTRYRLTPSGEELEAVIQAVDRWARKHLRAPVS